MSDTIVNRVAQSGIITLNLEDFYPTAPVAVFDIKDFLFRGLILREKDFREMVKTYDWAQFTGKNVAITCTADAIVPLWAYMVVASNLQPCAAYYAFGTEETLQTLLFAQNLASLNPEDYRNKRVVVKGCGEKTIPASAYVEITRLLKPVVKSLMYGEPCSTVPVYKQKEPDATT
ncbi:hypothetical protein C7N43_19135 [Sphingobacteriales bacterium UPWRP_1]|nr:hypothetical protein C7N43_19135 [Sphingobacteriales bacterium UPWRP_1]